MDKNSKKVLKFLNKSSSNKIPLACDAICKQCNIDYEYIVEITDILYKDKLLNRKCIIKSNGISMSGENYYYSTNKGKEYFDVQLKSDIKLYIKSIFCPIIVSIITNILAIILL